MSEGEAITEPLGAYQPQSMCRCIGLRQIESHDSFSDTGQQSRAESDPTADFDGATHPLSAPAAGLECEGQLARTKAVVAGPGCKIPGDLLGAARKGIPSPGSEIHEPAPGVLDRNATAPGDSSLRIVISGPARRQGSASNWATRSPFDQMSA